MKQNIPAPVAAVIALVVLAVAAYFVFAKAGARGSKQDVVNAQQQYHSAHPTGAYSPAPGAKSGQ